ncbi:hypothetical protein ACFQFH_16365 [Halobaculum halobium]|uniref:Major facilitator superfamily (MFS) profile domain-containing protein n=1 Tax=Halobaculum halobium TaxID=3032281 RepID=A0ABD5TD59_9EURY|nr:hypothetical protein [Halobaculum sp. SYNS20]
MTAAGDRRTRWVATALAVGVGLGLASAHWLGLVAGAALVALPQRTTVRGVAAGVAFGLLSLAVAVGHLALVGPDAIAVATEMTAPVTVAVGTALVGGAVGGLVRGLVG